MPSSDDVSRPRWSATLTLPPLDWSDLMRVHVHPGQDSPLYRAPAVAIIGGRTITCQKTRLPFRSAALEHMRIERLLEYAIDDQALIAEVARVLAPGAGLSLSVPNTRGVGRLDWRNIHRYAADVTGRLELLPELAESGWRRHYTAGEIASLLGEFGFRQIITRSTVRGRTTGAFGNTLQTTAVLGAA
jgi:hypothetical protein